MADSSGLTRALPTLGFDLADPVIRASLAPVVMELEAQGLTPETVSATDLRSAIAQAKVVVAAQAQGLLQQAIAAKPGGDELPGVVADLNMLQGPLGVYLPMAARNSVRLAQEQAHAKLDGAQRNEIDALLRRIANGLEGRTTVEALAGKDSVPEGAVRPESFARRHARLTKPEPYAPKAASAVDVPSSADGLERKCLTLMEERESAGLPPFKNIVIDVRGSRGGRGDVAAGYLVAKDILARARGVSGPAFQITVIMDETSQNILGGLQGKPVSPGQSDFEGRLSYHTLQSLPASFPAADLYLALARPSGKVYFEESLGYEESGGDGSGKIPVNQKTVILVQTVLGNTENQKAVNPFALLQVAGRKLSLLPAGLGANESGVYSDQVAWELRGKSRAEIRRFIMDSLPLVTNPRDRDVIRGILDETFLAGSEPGLAYGITASAVKGQFEGYLRGLAASARASGKSYVLITPSGFSKKNINDEALRAQVEVIAPDQAPDAPRAEPGKIYIVRTEGLPHPVFVGLMAYARPPPVVAGDGAMSAAIILGRPFVMTVVAWNAKNVANFRSKLLKGEIRTEVYKLLDRIYATPEPDLRQAQKLEAYAPLYENLVHFLPGLTSSILAAAQAAVSLLDEMVPIDLLVTYLSDLTMRADFLLQRSLQGEGRAMDLFAKEYLQAAPERRKQMDERSEDILGAKAKISRDGRFQVDLPPELIGTAVDAMNEAKVGIAGRFVAISPGQFMMGSSADDKDSSIDEGPHAVKLTRGFEMQAAPVTQRQYKLVTGRNPAHFKEKKFSDDDYMRVNGELMNADHPVEMVSWEDAQEFIKLLNASQSEHTYRLPTEAEWEYAARAGTKTTYWFDGDKIDDHAWHMGNSGDRTHAVSNPKHANPWGLYDMLGNVWEWTQDWYGAYPKPGLLRKTTTDPTGPARGSVRVIRGGSWEYGLWHLRSSYRPFRDPNERKNLVGFRLVRSRRSP